MTIKFALNRCNILKFIFLVLLEMFVIFTECLISVCYIVIAYQCRRDQFQCNNAVCIPITWQCDGTPDCSDASDETKDCGKYQSNFEK